MELNELKTAVEEMKAQGTSEEDILGTFYLKFVDGEISLEEFEALASVLGKGLSDEFKGLSEEEQKKYALTEESEPESDEEEAESEETEETESDEETEEESEEDEEKRAMKLLNVEQGNKNTLCKILTYLLREKKEKRVCQF